VPEENENIPVEETKKPPKTKTPAVVAEVKVVGIYATEYFKEIRFPTAKSVGRNIKLTLIIILFVQKVFPLIFAQG
jgi:hypothetical protein